MGVVGSTFFDTWGFLRSIKIGRVYMWYARGAIDAYIIFPSWVRTKVCPGPTGLR